MHGGSAPQVKAAAKRRVEMRKADEEARKALRNLDIDPIDDPVQELLNLAAETVAVKDFLAGRHAQVSVEHEADLVRAYGHALERASKLLVEINRLGLVERQTRLMERQAEVVATVMYGILNDLDVAVDERAMAVIRRHLLSLDSIDTVEVAS